jgi:N-acetyl-anhydromuramyl-L-alanine amidase AmpD
MYRRAKTEYIVLHTAASLKPNVTAAHIDTWHRQRGFEMIGYHYVIRRDGLIEPGRPERYAGAHCRGLNHNSIGICLTGHGDFLPWTPEQMRFLRELVNALREKYNIWIENVIGHREVNDLIAAGKLSARYRTDKTCPGKKIDMNALRLYILQGHQQHIFRLPGV